MGLRFVSFRLFLHLLLLMCVLRSTAKEFTNHNSRSQDGKDLSRGNIILEFPLDEVVKMVTDNNMDSDVHEKVLPPSQQPAMNDHAKQAHDGRQGAHPEHIDSPFSTHMHHMDPSLMVFFTMKDLKVGKKMPIYFPKRNPATSPHFLPREEADSIPFSLKELPYLLKIYNFSRESPQAKAMEDTLRECESKPIKGETKFCATSLESMLDFADSIFGMISQFKVVSTSYLTKSPTTFQNYSLLDIPEEISAPKMVACHTMPYPYAVFYCHSQESENKVFKVSLGGDNGDRVKAVVVCHLDTSNWGHNHVSFRVLGIEPGTSPVCHFFPADNLVYVLKSTSV
ncbi:BURP domain-containing protein [Quillaja saponaria]|uniref:BURP domain-containing protein n=1 Tax=Quillaja saponaria TaxID=32244 RepID=A0AAD7QBS5_QUISA|nr:BURP domain-containing protein [Quillaja saponaria]